MKNLTWDALGLNSDRVYHWQLLLEEFAPEIVYIKGIHNTVTDAISQLEYNPKVNLTNENNHAMHGTSMEETTTIKRRTCSKLWHWYNETTSGHRPRNVILPKCLQTIPSHYTRDCICPWCQTQNSASNSTQLLTKDWKSALWTIHMWSAKRKGW